MQDPWQLLGWLQTEKRGCHGKKASLMDILTIGEKRGNKGVIVIVFAQYMYAIKQYTHTTVYLYGHTVAEGWRTTDFIV